MGARIAFIGTEEFSREMLGELLRLGGSVCLVLSIAREHAGNIPEWRDLGEFAGTQGIEHHEVKSIRAEDCAERLRRAAPDFVFVMGIPQLISADMLAIPKQGTIATHPSLLPKNRGLNAIPWHILNGDAGGGLSIFPIGQGVDDGPIIAQRRFRISLTDTARTVYDRVVAAGREMLPGVLAMVERGEIKTAPQDESKATCLPRRLPDRRIVWKQNARSSYDLIRAMTDPYAGAYAYLGAKRLTVWDAGFSHEPVVARPGQVLRITDRGVEVATGAGLIVLRMVQIDGGKEPALDVFSRAGVEPGAILT